MYDSEAARYLHEVDVARRELKQYARVMFGAVGSFITGVLMVVAGSVFGQIGLGAIAGAACSLGAVIAIVGAVTGVVYFTENKHAPRDALEAEQRYDRCMMRRAVND